MARPNRSPKEATAAQKSLPTSDSAQGSRSNANPCVSTPPLWAARLVSTWTFFHFALIAISYASIVAPSVMQQRIINAFGPYLAIAHWDADDALLSFSDASPSEKTHVLSTSSAVSPETEEDWNNLAPELTDTRSRGGVKGGDRQRRWQRFLSTVAELGEREQGGLVAWLIQPVAQLQPTATHLRITRESDLMTTVVDDSAPPPYLAAIVRESNQPPRLIQAAPKRLASPAINKSNIAKP